MFSSLLFLPSPVRTKAAARDEFRGTTLNMLRTLVLTVCSVAQFPKCLAEWSKTIWGTDDNETLRGAWTRAAWLLSPPAKRLADLVLG
jgi:hypothetical protein